MNALVLAALPVLTGLQAVLWSQLVGFSRPGAALVNVVSAAILCGILAALYWRETTTPITQTAALYGVGYLVVNIVVALLWIAALNGSNISVIGFVEIGYPLFILLFGYLLVGNVSMTNLHWAGAAMIFGGTSLVIAANHL